MQKSQSRMIKIYSLENSENEKSRYGKFQNMKNPGMENSKWNKPTHLKQPEERQRTIVSFRSTTLKGSATLAILRKAR